MPATDSSVSCALSAALSLLAACSGPSPEAVRTTATADSVKSATPEAVTPPAPAGPQLANNKPSPAIPDPAWFSPAIYPTATVTKKGRSPADDQGRFTAQILFQLPDGASLADCTDPLARAVEGVVANLDREQGADGRVTLRGQAADYDVVFICGEVKGKMTAFVSYRWSKPQPIAPTP